MAFFCLSFYKKVPISRDKREAYIGTTALLAFDM